MAGDHEERLRQHEAILEGLARVWAAQHDMNQQQQEINQRLTLAIERIDRTLAQVALTQVDIQRLLNRMIQHGENGRDA